MFSNGLATGALAVLLAGSQLAAAHMEISYPAPFRSRFNPNAVNIDYTNTAPLDATGSNYPCKGYHSDLGTDAGEPTATFAPGGAYNFTIVGSATHGGGSCQVSLSYDKGKTFTVIQSIIGGCPLSSNYDFTIPADAPTGEAIWAWTWNNNIGNREQYMNCAAVTIGAGGAKREVEQRGTTAFSSRPQVFVANIGNGCATIEGTDVDYPNPGPDVITTGSLIGKPVGNCGSGAGSGSASSSTVQATVAPTSTTTPTPTPSKAVSLPGGVFITVPSQGATAAPTPTAAPTTLVSSTRTAVNPPASTGGNTSSGSAHAAGTACTSDGTWNCIGGSSFQRCANGAWSAAQAVAPGTVCKAGEGATLDVEAAAPTTLVSSTSTSGNTSSGSAHAAGTACTSNGTWNCIGGSSFQRCTNGAWSAVQAVAPGTVCKVGESATLAVEAATAAKKLRSRRFRGSAKLRLA